MEQPRIGVYVCWCGSNIAKMVDVERVAKEIAATPGVVVARDYKYMCSDPGQDLIIKDIKEHNLDRVVVSACSPRIHELTFRTAISKAGLNPYMFEMANIREQDSWVHTDREAATAKAKDLIVAAIHRIRFHEPLDSKTVTIDAATLVMGGGVAGMAAALEIADSGKKVFVAERSDRLGGLAALVHLTFPNLNNTQKAVNKLVERVQQHANIMVFLNTTIKEVYGYVGNFQTKVQNSAGKEIEIKFGHVIVATGLKPFDATKVADYGYGKLPNVITSIEFEKMLSHGKIVTKDGRIPESVAIIHCVGSRNAKYHEYCSRTCCATALKYANQIKAALPETHVFDLYADMRAFGKGCEELYSTTSDKGVLFFMFDQKDNLPKVKKADCGHHEMAVEMFDRLSGEQVSVPADLVVLMVGVEAHENAKDVAHAVGVSLCGSAFFIEKHPKLDPVATTTDGVFIVGACQGPKDIAESITQARAAAARVLGNIACGSVEIESTTATVVEELCCGCQTCVKVCPYSAVKFNEEKKVSEVNDVLCKGCGTCGAACPSGAIRCRHFTDQQILAQLEGMMEGGV